MAARNLLFQSNILPCCSVEDFMTKDQANELAQEAQATGSCPFSRWKVQIVGDARAGKTSLCKNLVGEKFNPREKHSETMEMTKCSFTPKKNDWKAYEEDAEAEIVQATEWYILSKIASQCLLSGKHVSKLMLVFAIFCFLLVPLIHGVWFTTYGLCLIYEAGRWKSMPMLVFLSWICLGPGLGFGSTNIMNAFWLNRVLTFVFMAISYRNEILNPTDPALTVVALVLVVYVFGYINSSQFRACCLTPILMKAYGLWVYTSAGDNFPCLVAISEDNVIEFFVLLFAFAIGAVVIIGHKCGSPIIYKSPVGYEGLFIVFVLIVSLVVSANDSHTLVKVAICGMLTGGAFIIGTVHGRQKSYYPSCWYEPIVHNAILSAEIAWSYTIEPIILGKVDDPLEIHVIEEFLIQWLCYFLLICGVSVLIYIIFTTKLPRSGLTLDDLFQKLEFVFHDSSLLDRPTVLTLLNFTNEGSFVDLSVLVPKTHVSIIVFDVVRFLKSDGRTREFKNIAKWIRATCRSTKSKFILVGTHIDHTNDDKCNEIQNFFKDQLDVIDNYFSSKIIWNGANPFFAIDNSKTLWSGDDCMLLKSVIELIPGEVQTEIPIRWLMFLKYVEKVRNLSKVKQSRDNLVVADSDEIEKVILSQIITEDRDEIETLLHYFHDIGEIYFHMGDKTTDRYVVMDPLLLPNIATLLLDGKCESEARCMSSLSDSCIHVPDIVTRSSVASLLGERKSSPFIQDVLKLLEITGIMSGTASRELPADEESQEDVFIIPSNLPWGNPTLPTGTHFKHFYYLDFGNSHMNNWFLILLARCQTLSELPYETGAQRYLYRESGLFTYGSQFFYRLSLVRHSLTQTLVEVALKAGHGEDPMTLLRRIILLVRDMTETEGITFHCGPLCPHEIPHQLRTRAGSDEDVHILELASSRSNSILSSPVQRMCHGREIDAEETISYEEHQMSSASRNLDGAETLTTPISVDVKGTKNIVITNSNIDKCTFIMSRSGRV